MTMARERDRDSLQWRVERLEAALAAGKDELDPHPVETSQRVLEKVKRRHSFSGHHTVVALAGATGSGKSTLFNALIGSDVAEIGARRPTTSRPAAAVWGQSIPNELMDWLDVSQRHYVKGSSRDDTSFPLANWPVKGFKKMPWGRTGFGRLGKDTAKAPVEPEPIEALDGLVLLDLPDFDSRVAEHRHEADRILELVDMFVWVTDPQKYADARLHEDYLRTMQHLDRVMIVVLNQVDLLQHGQTEVTMGYLKELLAEDGHPELEVLPTSGVTGDGMDALRQRIADEVMTRTASQRRLTGDLQWVARELGESVGPDPAHDVDPATREELVTALADAAAVPAVLNSVEEDYLRNAHASYSWPFSRWSKRMEPDPLKRLRLHGSEAGSAGITRTDVSQVLGRSSLPAPAPASRPAVDLAARDFGERASGTLPPRWAESVHEALTGKNDLNETLDAAVRKTQLRVKPPLWWSILGLVQWVLAAAVVLSGLWAVAALVMKLVGQGGLFFPLIGPVPVALVVFVAGILAGIAVSLTGRLVAERQAQERRDVVAARLDETLATVAEQQFVAPAHQVMDRHRRVRDGLDDVLS